MPYAMRSVSLVVPAMGSHLVDFILVEMDAITQQRSRNFFSPIFTWIYHCPKCVCVCVERTCVRKMCPTNVARIYKYIFPFSAYWADIQLEGEVSHIAHTCEFSECKNRRKEKWTREKCLRIIIICKIAKENGMWKMHSGTASAASRQSHIKMCMSCSCLMPAQDNSRFFACLSKIVFIFGAQAFRGTSKHERTTILSKRINLQASHSGRVDWLRNCCV